MKHSTFYLFQLISCFIFISCNYSELASKTKYPPKDKYPLFYKTTFEIDTMRVRIGLPTINKKMKLKWWTNDCYTEYMSYCIDFESTDTTQRPRFDSKSMITDTIEICKEKNIFIGPNYERLTISYGFKEYYDMKTLGFYCSFRNKNFNSISITKNQADSILKEWAVKF